jgi:outer membrane immunogenic protein
LLGAGETDSTQVTRLRRRIDMNKLPLAAGLALALSAGSALAADLPHYKAPPPPPPPMFSWTGLYAGVNIGYGFGNGDPAIGYQQFAAIPVGPVIIGFPGGATWNTPTNIYGVTGGAQLGANYQFNSWLVLGVETDIQAAGLSSNTATVSPFLRFGLIPAAGFVNASTHVDWWGTLRGRVGLTPLMPNLMIYGTAGLAYGAVNHWFSYTSAAALAIGPLALAATAGGNAIYDNVNFGWTAGGGVEWAPMAFPNWSLRLEYLFVDLGGQTLSTVGTGSFTVALGAAALTLPFINGASNTSYARWHTVRAGINYRFNFAPTPVVAKF